MSELFLLAISIFLLAPSNLDSIAEIMPYISSDEQSILLENNILTNDDYATFVSNNLEEKDYDTSIGYSSPDILLSTYYQNYSWNLANSSDTSFVTNSIPVNVNSNYGNYSSTNIQSVIADNNIVSTYGGCGPIAMIGIFDYFSNVLGYNNIETGSDLIADVLLNTTTIEVPSWINQSSNDATLTFPFAYSDAFNNLCHEYEVDDFISSSNRWTIFGGKKTEYFQLIQDNIDEGMPVTLCTGFLSGNDVFAKHYVNIFGYEIWNGFDSSTNTSIQKEFIKANINGTFNGTSQALYCDASILNDPIIGIITYSLDYLYNYNVDASDFSEEFVNSEGGGQYFNYNLATTVITSAGDELRTNRLRCSYIEDQYLVMSANRSGNGVAYLDINTLHKINKISFDSGLWSNNEFIINQTFVIQYKLNGQWIDYMFYDLADFSCSKDNLDSYTIIFPNRNINNIRFYSTQPNPTADRNKGRILLDNIHFYFNDLF